MDQIPIDLDQVLFHSVKVARIAGKILLNNFGKLKSQEIHKKTTFDFVTEADNASEEAIINYLSQYYPDHNIHAEESGKHEKKSEFLWLIDPLDGTKNYIQSFPIFSISIGLKYLDSFPTPLDAQAKNDVLCSRIRIDKSQPNTLELWVVGDQLLKGDALNAYQIAEYIFSKNKKKNIT